MKEWDARKGKVKTTVCRRKRKWITYKNDKAEIRNGR